jgi:hypothetical protein
MKFVSEIKIQGTVFGIIRRVGMGRDISVGTATRHGLEGPGIEPGRGEIFRAHPDQPWSLPSLLHDGYRDFTGGKAAGAWRRPPTPSSAEVKDRVEEAGANLGLGRLGSCLGR